MAKGQRKVGSDISPLIAELPAACCDDVAARDFLETHRWGGQPACPCCGSVAVYKMQDAKTGERERNGRLRCRDCKERFTVRTGTVMEESRIPLRHWCYAMWRATTSKKGCSALEIKRHTGLSYKSALFLMNRIRFGMQPENAAPLTGTVECDETYVGGKPRHPMSQSAALRKGKKSNYETRAERKTPVFAAVQRNGEARAAVVANVTASNLRETIRQFVDVKARLMTDEMQAYKSVGREQIGGHKVIQHKNRIYSRNGGDITTNTVESFFALFKRGLHGIYHNVSRKHLHRYVAECVFRYNCRNTEDGERVVKCLKAMDGKRLTYADCLA